jgi:hypothetical protein
MPRDSRAFIPAKVRFDAKPKSREDRCSHGLFSTSGECSPTDRRDGFPSLALLRIRRPSSEEEFRPALQGFANRPSRCDPKVSPTHSRLLTRTRPQLF